MLAHQNDSVQSPGVAQASRFLDALTGSAETPVTFQTFVDSGESSTSPAVIHAPLSVAWDRLLDLQEYGHGAFVMVNAGDGQGRSAAHVTGLRALFADDDAGSVRLSQLGLRPSIVVASGNGAHYYWLLRAGEPLATVHARSSFDAAAVRGCFEIGDDPVEALPLTIEVLDA